MEPWKTVVLNQDYLDINTYTDVWWINYLGMPSYSDSSDTNIYIACFNGNNAQQYKADFVMCYAEKHKITQRNGRSQSPIVVDHEYTILATAGTIIKIYKIPLV